MLSVRPQEQIRLFLSALHLSEQEQDHSVKTSHCIQLDHERKWEFLAFLKEYLFHFENSSMPFLFTESDIMYEEEKAHNKS